MAEALASIDYGTQRLTLTEAQTAVLARMLSRLPEDLWNTDPEALTLQRDLYQAIAGEIARWLESRTVATPMTLLPEAQGLDLDRLLRDYGLRRYFQRPDTYAQQIGLHCLYIPKATFYAVQRLADLLLAVPHVTLQTGKGEVHTFVADTRPVTAPYTYWRLVSDLGVPYSVTVHFGMPLCAPSVPPGQDTTPGGAPLDWFVVRDPAHAPWYVTVRGDALCTFASQPSGRGTTAPFQVLDHASGVWVMTADPFGVLVTTPVAGTGPSVSSMTRAAVPMPRVINLAYWRLQSADGVVALSVEGQVPTFSLTVPGGGIDETPGGVPLDWIAVHEAGGSLWSLTVQGRTLVLTAGAGTGVSTTTPLQLRDAQGDVWDAFASPLGVLETQPGVYVPPPDPEPTVPPTSYWRVRRGAGVVAVYVEYQVPTWSATFPTGSDETPTTAPLDWIALTDSAGTLWSVTVEGDTFVTSHGAGSGASQPGLWQQRDAAGALWTMGITPLGVLFTTSGPPPPAPPTAPVGATPWAAPLPVLDPAHPYETCQLVDSAGGVWWLAIETGTGVLWPTPPSGATDVTPLGGPYRWLRLYDLQGSLWYGFPDTQGTWTTSLVSPGGRGSKAPQALGDARGVQWHYGIDPAGAFTTSQRPSVTYGGLSSTLIIRDAHEVAWCWRITTPSGTPFFEVSRALGEDAVATSPWGSIAWLTLVGHAGGTMYVFPSVYTGMPTVQAGPPPGAWWGWTEPITFVDQRGTEYVLSLEHADVLTYTALPPDDIPAPAATLSLRDFRDAMVHVRAQGTIVTLSVA